MEFSEDFSGRRRHGGWDHAVSRDGRFLVNTILEDAASPITLLQNWRPPAK